MAYRIRDAVVDEATQETAIQSAAEEAVVETPVEVPAVEEAMRLIQKHIDKEARNRWVEHLDVRDLCPRQKADMISDLARLF
jgi:septum formation inhibitor-activating ATPase MinD